MDYSEEDYFNRRGGFQAGNVPEQESMSTPVRGDMSTGGITPTPDNSGLYAIYGRKNPAQAKANRLMEFAGRDMGGKLGQLPGIMATLMAGKAQKEADVVDAAKEAAIKAYMGQKEAYDKIKNDRETRMYNAKVIKDIIIPQARQVYRDALTKGDPNPGEKAGAAVNSMKSDYNVPMGDVVSFDAWADADTMSAVTKSGKKVTAVHKDGAFGIQTAKGIIPADEELLSLKDLSEYERATAASKNAGAKSLKDYDLSSISAQLNSLRQLRANSVDLSPEESAQYEALNNEFNRRTGVTVTPPPPPVSEVAPPPAAPAPQTPWTSGSGNSASPLSAQGQQYSNKESVALAYKSGKISRQEAEQILSNQFGVR